MEKIKCAAIKYYLLNDDTPRYVEGPNHGFCIEQFGFQDLYTTKRQIDKEVQGFMTSEGKFVTRVEAYQIAKNAGQLIKEVPSESLDSYNINYS